MRRFPRSPDRSSSMLRRINGVAGVLNPLLVAFAVGLTLLDLACVLKILANAALAACLHGS